jgi:hypothetical protein
MSIDPKILKRMQGEDSFLQSQTRGSRRVKLNRGQNWIVRFLPAQMGPDGLWFARVARHWLNKLPIVCPRNTAIDFGGDPDCECPACLLADELNESADEVISKFGYKSKANVQYLTYCVVWEKEGVQQPMSEILNPYEFNHYRNTFEELKGFYLAGGRKCPNSVFDYEKGNDFSVSKTAKGMRLDKQDSSPIFDLDDPKFADYIKKLEAALKTPKVVIPTHEQLQVFAAKLQEAANRGGVPAEDDDRPRRGGYDDEAQFRRPARRGTPTAASTDPEDDLPYDAPPARPAARAAAAPARRLAPEPEDAGEESSPRRQTAPVDDDPTPPRRGAPAEDSAAPPRRRTAPAEEAPARRAAPAAAPTTARRPAPEPESDPGPETDPDGGDALPVEDDQPVRNNLPNTTRRTLPPTARRAAGGEPASAPQGDHEEDDPLPEDDTDPAPPAEKPEAEDAPPPVARRGSAGADIKARLAKLPKGA